MENETIVLEIGATYLVNHHRKGLFECEIISEQTDGQFFTARITEGSAQGITRSWQIGEEITMRKAFCKFTKQKPK